MIKDISEIYIPQIDGKPVATLNAARVSLMDMAEKTIEADIRVPRTVNPDFSADWVLSFRGEKYVMSDREPQGTKSNDSKLTLFNLTFHHWAVKELKRWLFFTVQPIESGTAVADQYEASVSLNLKGMCDLFAQVLDYYFHGDITINLNPGWEYAPEPKVVEISNSYLWDVLIKFYELWAVRWQIEPVADIDHYVIKVGYNAPDISHTFKYGFEGGLLKMERQLQSGEIKNLLNGRGGQKNLPARYFKDVDSDNPSFPADPDWIPELRDVYFDRLRGKSFRDYIKGWATNPNRQLKETDGTPITPYPHDSTVSPIAVRPYDKTYAGQSFAYFMGHTDSKFRPIEYVADKYEVVGLSKVSPVAGSSIDRHGEMMGGLTANDEIYPTIQGVEADPIGRVDEAVWVEQIEKDDYKEAASYEAQTEQLEYQPYPGVSFEPGTRVIGENLGDREGVYFTVEAGKAANIRYNAAVTAYTPDTHADRSTYVQLLETQISVYDATNPSEPLPPEGIPEGRYFFIAKFKVQNTYSKALNVVCAINDIKLEQADAPDTWRHTFDILIKNIWGTEQGAGESDEAYAERVWGGILGDKEGNEAKVVFSDGMLATSQDYEFAIKPMPKVDRTLCQWESDGVTHTFRAEWRLTLAKSEADLEALGLYVPSTKRQGKAGDHFFFTGIDLPHQYVLWAEERLDAYKTDQFKDTAEANVSLSVTTDRVRINNYGNADALIGKITPGAAVTLFDEQLIEGGTETLYVESVTITYREPDDNDAALNPDVEMTLSKEYSKAANPVAMLQGEVSAISKQIGAVSNVEQIVRTVGDRLYLRKDAIPDSSLSPTQFYSLVTSGDFRSGMIGGAGWGLFQDASGAWVLEADKVNIRRDMQVNNLVINQVIGRGGMIVESAAAIEVTKAVTDENSDVKCYFDTKNGTVANLFRPYDIALCHRFTPENGELKYYRRIVWEVGADYVLLSGDESNGDGMPDKGDVLVQFGNTTDANRQYVIVRDVIGGGYERFIEGLDDLFSEGREYVFIGKQDGQAPRFFVGDRSLKQYIEYQNGKFVISGDVRVLGRPVTDVIQEEVGNLNVGGTNLFLGSQDWDITKWTSATSRITPGSYDNPQYYNGALIASLAEAYTPFQTIANAVYDEDYTLSAWIKSTADSQIIYFTFLTAKGLSDTTISPLINISGQLVKDKWARVKYSFKMPISNDTALRVGFRFSGVNGSNTFIAGMKLERGNVATDWSKNPQDNDTKKFDYLREAMQQDTTIEGGLVQTSTIMLGQTSADGTRTVWAGTNGLYANSKSMSLWAGGNMADAEYSNDPRPAKFAVRMDGTGYMAGNTVKFTDSQLQIGEDTILDANGFITTTVNDEGGKSEVVRIANIDMPTIGELLNPTNIPLEKSWTDSGIIVQYAATGFNILFAGETNSVLYTLANNAALPAGAALSISFSALINLTGLGIVVPTDPFAVYSTPSLLLQIVYPAGNSVIYEQQKKIAPKGGVTQFMVSFDSINTILAESGVYALKLTFVGIPPLNARTADKTMTTRISGQAVSSRSAQTIIAKNGFASVWGQSILFVNNKYAMLRSDKYGFRVSPQGFQYSVDGSTWKTLNWT